MVAEKGIFSGSAARLSGLGLELSVDPVEQGDKLTVWLEGLWHTQADGGSRWCGCEKDGGARVIR